METINTNESNTMASRLAAQLVEATYYENDRDGCFCVKENLVDSFRYWYIDRELLFFEMERVIGRPNLWDRTWLRLMFTGRPERLIEIADYYLAKVIIENKNRIANCTIEE